ncbi:hypothetical protein ACRTDO_09760 [Vibrio furnissii]|uniref:hypothetical protein n=1 Tax=Vibrio furnissii TaxID=29494 RepID=UPI003D7CD6EA
MSETLYQHATVKMKEIIDVMLTLSQETVNFHQPEEHHFENEEEATILLCGKGYLISEIPDNTNDRKNAWLGRAAIDFGIERAATSLLYKKIRPFIADLVEEAFAQTNDFNDISASWINENPHFLPVMMHALGIFSKRDLQKQIGKGNASDTSISKPVSEKLASLFERIETSTIPNKVQITERIKGTTEGIVRDLVGRLLLEDFVAQALENESVPFLREDAYESISGVVYDFRADFVIPSPQDPKAFIEVRKSSAGHASLYAKDKMFSAINWKGKHQKCLGIVVVDGPWTQTTLEVMSRVFDYVIPVERANEVAEKIRHYLDGDETVLRWLIQFQIQPNR